MEEISRNSAKRILVFGGTFDPPHLAHALLPAQAATQLHCDLTLYIPAAVSPLKTNEPSASREHRLAMLLLALADVPNAKISTIELDREGPSYTIDTLRMLHDEYSPKLRPARSTTAHRMTARVAAQAQPASAPPSQALSEPSNEPPEFRLLIGADQALDFHRWKDWQQILTLATPAVMLRPPWDELSFRDALLEKYSKVESDSWLSWTLRLPRMDVNATETRRQLREKNHHWLKQWIAPAVLDYICANNLYR